jgi:hypothetical protein
MILLACKQLNTVNRCLHMPVINGRIVCCLVVLSLIAIQDANSFSAECCLSLRHDRVHCNTKFHFIHIIIIFSGVRLSLLVLRPLTGLLYQPRMIGDGDCGEIGGMKIGRENQSSRR